MEQQIDHNAGIGIWVQCHICKEWHELTAEEVVLYINQEHEGLPWKCPECIE